jgi:hypothetical protein
MARTPHAAATRRASTTVARCRDARNTVPAARVPHGLASRPLRALAEERDLPADVHAALWQSSLAD